jgi:hypothetical protein
MSIKYRTNLEKLFRLVKKIQLFALLQIIEKNYGLSQNPLSPEFGER